MPDTIGVDANRYPLYRWVILACVSLSICACSMAMTGIAPILETIAEDLGVPVGTAANLMLAYVLAISLFFPLAGMICDRYGLTAALVSGLLCSCIPAVMMPCLATYRLNTFICLRFIQGAIGCISTRQPCLCVGSLVSQQGTRGGKCVDVRCHADRLFHGGANDTLSVGPHGQLAAVDLDGVHFGLDQYRFGLFIYKVSSTVGGFCNAAPKIHNAERDVICKGHDASTNVGRGLHHVLQCLVSFLPLQYHSLISIDKHACGCRYVADVGRQAIFIRHPVRIFRHGGGRNSYRSRGKREKYHLAMWIGFFMTAIANVSILIPEFQKDQFLLALALFVAGCGMPLMSASISYYLVSRYPAAIVGRMMGVWYGVGTLGGAMGIYLAGISIIKNGNFHWAILQISIAAIMGLLFSWLLPVIDTAGRKLDYATSV